ncbi:pentapeptide repeat-containing protein [Aliarcobacter butzleri]
MSKNICSVCNVEVEEEYFDKEQTKCILHCEKSDWLTISNPADDEYELGTEVIYYWDEKKVQKFWNKFKEVIEEKPNLSKEDSYYRFHDFIFPKMEQDTFKDYTFNCDLVFTKNCIFKGNIDFFQTVFNGEVYFNDCKIKGKVSFGKSIFKDRFTFNNMKEIKEVSMRYANFEKKVEFKETHCKNVDFENSTFAESINFEKTTFRDISVFANVTFKNDVNFKYTTFEKIGQFKETIFEKTLNLEDSIIKEKINFLKIKTKDNKELNSCNMVNRETARIIKDSFEKQNNIIEANKYYALEMKKREKELEEDIREGKNFFEWLVFKIHGLSSNHSQDWLLALFWIISFTFTFLTMDFVNTHYLTHTVDYILIDMIIFLGFVYGNYLIIEYEKINKFCYIGIYYIFYGFFSQDWLLKCFSNKLNPFSIMRGDEPITLGTLIYKIIIAYLIYQLIISIRQNTRRK